MTTTKVPYVILGDQGCSLKDYLTLTLLTWKMWWDPNNARKWQMGFNSAFKGSMRPYITDKAAFCHEIEVYNYRHSRARWKVECAFGILVSKWRCLKTELQVSFEHVDKLVSACLFHNLIIYKVGIDEATLQKLKSSDLAEVGASAIRGPRHYNRATRETYNICERFKIYFNGEGPLISNTIKSTPMSNEIYLMIYHIGRPYF